MPCFTRWISIMLIAFMLPSCAGREHRERRTSERVARPEWALVIHGGAGVSKSLSDPEGYRESLRQALTIGRAVLNRGGSSTEAVIAVVKQLEDDPRFNAGRGAVFTSEGTCELDASLMDGNTLQCGAVSGVTTIKNPILLAERIMTESKHVFLVGRGAETFAEEQGLERVENSYFQTDRRRHQWEKRRARADRDGSNPATPSRDVEEPVKKMGTVGAVALDRDGNLAAATSTGGLTNKRYGRVGDSPIIGAGTYASNESCAVSCTGTGELFIRHGIAHALAARVRFGGQTLEQAANILLTEVLPTDSGGMIAIDRNGRMIAPFNTDGMFRGMANSEGRFEIGIFED